MTASDNEWYEWQWMTTSNNKWYNEWQQMAMSDSGGTTNENGTVQLKEWMITVLSMTKTYTLLLQGMDGCS